MKYISCSSIHKLSKCLNKLRMTKISKINIIKPTSVQLCIIFFNSSDYSLAFCPNVSLRTVTRTAEAKSTACATSSSKTGGCGKGIGSGYEWCLGVFFGDFWAVKNEMNNYHYHYHYCIISAYMIHYDTIS